MRDIVAAACGCDARHGLQHEELVVLRLLVAIGACGFLQLGFAIIIPHFTTGLLGLLVSLCCIVFSLEIWHNRRVAYLMFGVMQPLPLVIIAYIDYAMLAEAIDNDEVTLATEDDLERSVKANITDRVAAYCGVFFDCLLIVLSFALAEAVLAMRRVYIGEVKDDAPWVVQLLNSTKNASGAGSAAFVGDEATRRAGRDEQQQRRGSLGHMTAHMAARCVTPHRSPERVGAGTFIAERCRYSQSDLGGLLGRTLMIDAEETPSTPQRLQQEEEEAEESSQSRSRRGLLGRMFALRNTLCSSSELI